MLAKHQTVSHTLKWWLNTKNVISKYEPVIKMLLDRKSLDCYQNILSDIKMLDRY